MTKVVYATRQDVIKEVAARLTLVADEAARVEAAGLLVAQLEPRVDKHQLTERFRTVCDGRYRAAGSLCGGNADGSHNGFSVHVTGDWANSFVILRIVDQTGAVSYRVEHN